MAIYRPRIFRFALASLRDRDAAETITQDCFLNAYRARDRFRNDCSMQTWLMQIAVNLVRDHARNRRLQFWKRTRNAPPVEELASLATDGGRRRKRESCSSEQVQGDLECSRRVFPRSSVACFSVAVCGGHGSSSRSPQLTGMKEGTVKTHLFRALKSVRERMGAKL